MDYTPLPHLAPDDSLVVDEADAPSGFRSWQIRGPLDDPRLAGTHPLCPDTWGQRVVRASCLARSIWGKGGARARGVPRWDPCAFSPGADCDSAGRGPNPYPDLPDWSGGCGLWADRAVHQYGAVAGRVRVWGTLRGTAVGVRAEYASIDVVAAGDDLRPEYRAYLEAFAAEQGIRLVATYDEVAA